MTSAAYIDAGQVLTRTDPLGRVTSYAYDSGTDWLEEIELPDPDGMSGHPTIVYSHDNVGNVETITDPLGNITTNSYDPLNRLVNVTQADPDGGGPLTAPETDYAFDDAGQLTSVTDPVGRVSSYSNDNLGRGCRHALIAWSGGRVGAGVFGGRRPLPTRTLQAA